MRGPSSSLSLECLWLLNLSVTPNSVLPLTLYSLFISMFPLSVFLLTVFGLSLCFSCPRRPQEDPKPLAVPGIISSMYIDVEDSLGYWEIPEAHCSPVVSPSAFTKWLLLTEHSWRGFGQRRMSQGIAQKKEICKLFSVSCRLETRANENNNKRKSWQIIM